jgi:ketosteroid isomerase-like protein
MNIESIAKRLVGLCREGNFEQAQKELYAANAVSIEPENLPPGALGNAKGLAAILEKGKKFAELTEKVHAITVSEPLVADNWFSITMALDVTMKGRGRANMKEICVYHVRDGKIVQEQFFYDIG